MYVLKVLRPHHEEVGKEACKIVGICEKRVVHRLNSFFETVEILLNEFLSLQHIFLEKGCCPLLGRARFYMKQCTFSYRLLVYTASVSHSLYCRLPFAVCGGRTHCVGVCVCGYLSSLRS